MVVDPVIFSIGSISIYWYGLTYAIGFLFSYFFITHFSKDFGLKREVVEDAFFYFVISSVIGGRLFHIIFYDLTYYLNNLSEIIRFDRGGMSIHGGIFFGFLAILFVAKKNNVNLLKITDLFVIPASLGLSFGRLANFVNQELVGKVTNSIFGVEFVEFEGEKRHPVVLYESIKNMFTFQVLMFLFVIKKLQKTPGVITAWFLILFNGFRFIVDFMREPDVLIFLNISMGQFLSLIFFLVGIILLIKLKNK